MAFGGNGPRLAKRETTTTDIGNREGLPQSQVLTIAKLVMVCAKGRQLSSTFQGWIQRSAKNANMFVENNKPGSSWVHK